MAVAPGTTAGTAVGCFERDAVVQFVEDCCGTHRFGSGSSRF